VDIALANWEPDRAGIDTGLLTVARNAWPATVGWGPMPGLTEFGSTALPAHCEGLFSGRGSSGAYQLFACTATAIYRLSSGTWVNVTRTSGAYALIPGNLWRSAQWGSLLILVNGTDQPQVFDLDGSPPVFRDLRGAPPIAKDVSVVGDFVFMVDAANPRRLVWCGYNGPDQAGNLTADPPIPPSWSVGDALADEYVAPDGGNVLTAPTLGEYGVFLQNEQTARRVVLQPGDPYSAFRFEKIESVKGAVSTYCACASNGKLYYLAEEGFYSLDPGGTNVPIGTQRVDRWFKENSDQNRVEEFQAFADLHNTRVYWAYFSNSGATTFDSLIGYDWLLDRWFHGTGFAAATYAPVAPPAMNLEQLGVLYPLLDDYPLINVDSRQFQGGRITLATINEDGLLAWLTGPALEARFLTAGGHLAGPARAWLSEAEAIGEFGDAEVTLRVGTREYSGGTRTQSDPFERYIPDEGTPTGRFFMRVSGRIHDFELTIGAGGTWTMAQALVTKEQPDGVR
jgi:hypothetical protein